MLDGGSLLAQWGSLIPFVLLVLGIVLFFYWSEKSERQANEKAKLLVGSILTPEELQQLHTAGYLEISSRLHPGRAYRIPSGPGMVEVIEAGKCSERLCVQSMEQIPQPEVVLMHKLMIEGNEPEYLEKANHFPCYFWSPGGNST